MFGDSESLVNDDVHVIIGRKATGDWGDDNGLGISHEEALLDSRDLPKPLPPHLIHEESAPGRLQGPKADAISKVPVRQRSSDKMRAKRDDEDEELGDVYVREKTSPRGPSKTHRGSKLGTEMMRTNSRGSVVSTSDLTGNVEVIEPPPTVAEEPPSVSEVSGATLTPPEYFMPIGQVADIDMNETPKPPSHFELMDEDPTPRASSVVSKESGYMSR
jgi:serine/threonine-protein kinase RIM15